MNRAASRVALVTILAAAVLATFTSFVYVPLHRSLAIDGLVGVVSLRLVFDARAMRRSLWAACWIASPAMACVIQRVAMASHHQQVVPEADATIGVYVAAAAIWVALVSCVPRFREWIWSLDGRSARWMTSVAAGGVIALLELAAARHDGPSSMTLGGTGRIHVAPLVLVVLLLTAAPTLRVPRLALLVPACVAGMTLGPGAARAACLGLSSAILLAEIFRGDAEPIAVAHVLHGTWSMGAALTASIAVLGTVIGW